MNSLQPNIYRIDSTSYLVSLVPEKSFSLVYEYQKLSDAVFSGNKEECERLAGKIDDINAVLCFNNYKKSYTLLRDAVLHGNEKIAMILLNHGACPDSPNMHGKTPRMLAKKKGKAEIIELFQKYKPENVELPPPMHRPENDTRNNNIEMCIIS